MTILRVALPVPLPRLFDYLAEDSVQSDRGRLVRVPFGSGSARGSRVGVVIESVTDSDQPADKLKPVQEILRELPALPDEWLALVAFCSRYYQHPLGEVAAMALPPMLRRGRRPQRGSAVPPAPTFAPPPELLPEQRAAVSAIAAGGGFAPFLLHGVTGSGKTEVYLQAIAAVLERGGQALMLVPEIGLTPQLEARVAARFPAARIVAAHSGVAEAARARGFLDALEGRADIVLGTRLAVFMPLPRLRLIVVDEEHDASFKQQEGLRYSARDVAVWRAREAGIPIVLGSATPSLESFQRSLDGGYRLLELTARAAAETMPAVRLVDTRREKLQEGLSAAALDALAARLERGEQSLVFLNRRGYAPVLACPSCGWMSGCRRCAANLVVHLADRRLRCHHCGYEAGIPPRCPDCGNQDLQPYGRGTQRLEASLAARFPQARLLRIDRDSASTPRKWQQALAAIHDGEADILVGTQMLAKGHDFPRLTLVVVAGADAALFAADFRAPERLFAQLMQVGGRSGRADLAGEVLIQTEHPGHPLYAALAGHDYRRFAVTLLDERAQAGFPPFTRQALLRAEAGTMEQALGFLAAAREAALPLAGEAVLCYDPVPMRLARMMTLERAQLLVESASRPALQAFLANWMARLYARKAPRGLRWHLDVDPLEF